MVGGAVLFVALGAWCFLFEQDLSVTQNSRGTFIDARFLGEYYANARRLRITDLEDHVVVWELKARNDFFPVSLVSLEPGENPALPEGAQVSEVKVIVPDDESFSLVPGRRYRVEVWSYKSGMRRHASEAFTLAQRPGA